ncbi:hypothetical protein [Rhizobium rhizogenes]|uniref:hypothetical protein n=1 Tax=Rhizobium rhizogenes TaxID=359 RepID=UPI001574BBDD|nr:hypothetical protein [Rhizobium rhizogenes]NTF67686.1 hypothetical protein [Rhizobium rhizogenes]
MNGSPYPIPRQLRQTDVFVGDGGAVYSGFNFKVFDADDVTVWTRVLGEDVFVRELDVTVEKVSDLPFDDFTVTFLSGQPVTTEIVVLSARLDSRSAGVINGTRIDPTALEKELSKIATIEQELRRDIDRAVRSDFGAPSFVIQSPIPDGSYIKVSNDHLVAGINVEQAISGFQDTTIALAAALQAETTERIAADVATNVRIDGMVDSVSDYAAQAAASAILATNAEAHAVELVQEATAGFTGWPDGTILDLGRVTEANHYFNQNWGRVTDA